MTYNPLSDFNPKCYYDGTNTLPEVTTPSAMATLVGTMTQFAIAEAGAKITADAGDDFTDSEGNILPKNRNIAIEINDVEITEAEYTQLSTDLLTCVKRRVILYDANQGILICAINVPIQLLPSTVANDVGRWIVKGTAKVSDITSSLEVKALLPLTFDVDTGSATGIIITKSGIACSWVKSNTVEIIKDNTVGIDVAGLTTMYVDSIKQVTKFGFGDGGTFLLNAWGNLENLKYATNVTDFSVDTCGLTGDVMPLAISYLTGLVNLEFMGNDLGVGTYSAGTLRTQLLMDTCDLTDNQWTAAELELVVTDLLANAQARPNDLSVTSPICEVDLSTNAIPNVATAAMISTLEAAPYGWTFTVDS